MRVTNRLLYSALVRDIGMSTEKMLSLNKQISSAKVIAKPSDDPIGMSNVLTYRTGLYSSDQFDANITMATGWSNTTDTILTNVDDLLSRAAELTAQQTSTTATDVTRTGAAAEVAELLDALTGLANSKYGNKYMFGGTLTQDAPFLELDPDNWAGEVSSLSAAPAAPADGAVIQVTDQGGDLYIYNAASGAWQSQYQGNDDTFSVKVGRTDTMQVNINGDDTFSDAFKALLSLHAALMANDTAGISAQASAITDASTAVNHQLAIIGAKENHLDQAQYVLDDNVLDLQERLSTIEDLDFAEAVTELENQQIIYQATLKSASMITQLSLVDYI